MDTVVTKETVGMDVLDMFPGIESSDILTSKPSNILSNDNDLSFIDKDTDDKLDSSLGTGKEKVDTTLPTPPIDQTEADKILNSIGKDEDIDNDTDSSAGTGRPKTDKNALAAYLKEKIEAGDFSTFDDYDEKKQTIDEYLSKQSEKTLYQMLDANWESKERELLERTPKEFFEALPEELQYAARYAMEGGTDMKGLFAALARVEQVRSLDPADEDGQIAITRSYLQATNFGSPELIEEQIAEWKEEGKLEKKAKTFKPTLDEMQKEQVEYQLEQQAEWNRQQQQAAQMYVNNVHRALEKADLNGIKIDKRTQAALYQGLTTVAYPSASGKPTNLLGHMLDKIQYVEPNFELLAEVTYLLSDPEAYKNAIRQQGKNAAVTEVVKKLKTEQMNNPGSYGFEDETEDKVKTKKITKPKNLFARD